MPLDSPEPDEAGDAVCWLPRVCPCCGRLADHDPPTQCASCGSDIPDDDGQPVTW